MHRIFRCFLILVLFSASVTAIAQDSGSAINKQDLPDPRSSIDQNPVSTGDVPFTGQGNNGSAMGKVRISNASSLATDTSTSNKSLSGKDVQQLQSVADAGKRARPDSEFQKFVQDSIGKHVPIYGTDLFDNTPSTFAPVSNAPIPSEYPLGPGDEVLVRGWGTIDIDYRATIDRNGTISMPVIGTVTLGGVPAGQAENVIQAAIAKLYKGVNISVTYGHMRSITVYVVGQASRPGTYTVSNVSTLITALFASGGPGTNGSMRRIQVKRGGKVVTELDLYEFIAKGDKHADIKLQDGDTIYIPPALGYAALVGEVNSPAIFELRSPSDTVADLLDLAGGLPVLADPRRAFLERIDPNQHQPRRVEEFALDAEGSKKLLKNGDLLNITSITPGFSNAVVLRGNVDHPIRAPFKQGMRVSDLIPSRDFLISRAALRRQNDTALTRDADGAGDKRNGSDQASLNGNPNGSKFSPDKQNAPRIGDLLDEINWDYAVIERVNRSDLSVSLIPFNLGRIFDSPGDANNVALQPGDTITIFSQDDIAVPREKKRIFVRVEGEVSTPGIYQMNQGDNLQMLLARAGGPTHDAYLFGTGFYRDQVKKEQEINMQKAIDKLEARLQSAQSRIAANVTAQTASDAQIAENQRQAGLAAGMETIARMRKLEPTGRISFGLDPTDRSFNKLPELKLENGDRLVIPARPDFVHVFGSVNSESSLMWRPEEPASAYIKRAGVSADADVENIFIIRADGSVISPDPGSWFTRSITGLDLMPGDSIVVPEKIDKQTSYTRFIMGLKDWTQIFANFGIAVAAIHVL